MKICFTPLSKSLQPLPSKAQAKLIKNFDRHKKKFLIMEFNSEMSL